MRRVGDKYKNRRYFKSRGKSEQPIISWHNRTPNMLDQRLQVALPNLSADQILALEWICRAIADDDDQPSIQPVQQS